MDGMHIELVRETGASYRARGSECFREIKAGGEGRREKRSSPRGTELAPAFSPPSAPSQPHHLLSLSFSAGWRSILQLQPLVIN